MLFSNFIFGESYNKYMSDVEIKWFMQSAKYEKKFLHKFNMAAVIVYKTI